MASEAGPGVAGTGGRSWAREGLEGTEVLPEGVEFVRAAGETAALEGGREALGDLGYGDAVELVRDQEAVASGRLGDLAHLVGHRLGGADQRNRLVLAVRDGLAQRLAVRRLGELGQR